MTKDMVTIELAKLFESQGYYRDALDIYKALDAQESDSQIRAGVTRMEARLAMAPDTQAPGKHIARLLEKWLDLIILKHRLNRFKQIKARLA